jgi:hypothetical protein
MDSRENVVVKMEGSVLHIMVETDQKKVSATPSASGKTVTLATTGGYQWGVAGSDVVVNLTVSRRR